MSARRAGLYLACAGRESGGSLQARRAALLDYCGQAGFAAVAVYLEQGRTAGKHPAFRRLLNDAENGKIDLLLIEALPEFSDSDGSERLLLQTFPEKGIRLIVLGEGVDTAPQKQCAVGQLAQTRERLADAERALAALPRDRRAGTLDAETGRLLSDLLREEQLLAQAALDALAQTKKRRENEPGGESRARL